MRGYQNVADQNQLLQQSVDSSFHVATTYINKNGELVHQVNTFELTIKDLRDLSEQLGFDNKALKEQVGNLKNLVGYWKGQATASGSVDNVPARDTVYITTQGDTVQAQGFTWTNNFLSLNGTYNSAGKKFAFQYKYDLGGFEITAYRKREPGFKGYFKQKQLVTDINFGDPNMQVTSFQGLVIKEERKKFWETKGFAFGVGVVTGAFLISR